MTRRLLLTLQGNSVAQLGITLRLSERRYRFTGLELRPERLIAKWDAAQARQVKVVKVRLRQRCRIILPMALHKLETKSP